MEQVKRPECACIGCWIALARVQGKAARQRRHSKTLRDGLGVSCLRQVLECAGSSRPIHGTDRMNRIRISLNAAYGLGMVVQTKKDLNSARNRFPAILCEDILFYWQF
jgi:hypothetical protein